jgi:hypothetical protein
MDNKEIVSPVAVEHTIKDIVLDEINIGNNKENLSPLNKIEYQTNKDEDRLLKYEINKDITIKNLSPVSDLTIETDNENSAIALEDEESLLKGIEEINDNELDKIVKTADKSELYYVTNNETDGEIDDETDGENDDETDGENDDETDSEMNDEEILLDEAEKVFQTETFENVKNFINSYPELKENVCNIAVENNRLDILKWARQNQYPIDESSTIEAINSGNLEILNWLKENDGIFTKDANNYAIISNKIDILEWIQKNFDFVLTKEDCETAAMYDRLSVLKWLRANKCPWNLDTIECSIINGSFRCLVYILDNGCNISYEELNSIEADINNSLQESEEIDSNILKCLEYAKTKCIISVQKGGNMSTDIVKVLALVGIIVVCTFLR